MTAHSHLGRESQPGNMILDFKIIVQEKLVVGHGLFREMLQHGYFRAVDDGVNALLKGLHGVKCLEPVAQQNNQGVTPLVDGHVLQRAERKIFLGFTRGKQFLDDDDLITDLAEARGEIRVRRGRVNLVAEFAQRPFGGVEPRGIGTGDQRGLVPRGDEHRLKVVCHGHLSLMVGTGSAGECAPGFIFSELTLEVISPRCFLTLSMLRETTPRLLQ